MATKLFGASFPEWFGDLGASLYTLFQIMTLESWSMGIVRPVMETHPYAWLFFIPFILIATFTILNLFIAIIVDTMQNMHDSTHQREQAAIEDAVHDEGSNLGEQVQAVRDELRELKHLLLQRERKSD
jgi:voltage-gated sodium channel